jgi:hypothetical protein
MTVWTSGAGLFLIATVEFSSPAYALYQFATRDGQCEDVAIDRINDGSDLRLPLGTSRVVLWGFAMDTVAGNHPPTTGVSGTGTSTVNVVQRRTGSDNLNGPCQAFIGSVVVDITNGPATNTQNFRRTINLPLQGVAGFGAGTAHVPISIRVFPTPVAEFQAGPTVPLILGPTGQPIPPLPLTQDPCLSSDVQFLDNNVKLRIQLPPGASTDESNCTFGVAVHLTENADARVAIDPGLHLTLSGAPAFVQMSIPSQVGGCPLFMNFTQCDAVLTFSTLQVRHITTLSASNIRFVQPNGTQSNPLRLEVLPATGSGFAQNPTVAPQVVQDGDPFDVHFAIAPAASGAGQQINFVMDQTQCFDLSPFPDAPGSADPAVHELPGPIAAGQTTAIITIHAAASTDPTCAGNPTPVTHELKAFFPGTDAQVCPPTTCRRAKVRVSRP